MPLHAAKPVEAGWTAALASALDRLPSRFPSGALGYLTATSKVERPVCDAVAHMLHEKHGSDGIMVAREWIGRRDLAIVQGSRTLVDIEAKALYSLDVVRDSHRRKFLSGLKFGHAKDVHRLIPVIDSGGLAYLLSLVTHPGGLVPRNLYGVIAYADLHNRTLARFPDANSLQAHAQRWGDDLSSWGPLAHHVHHDLGTVYGVGFFLDCYLVGPLGSRALANLASIEAGTAT